MKLFSMFKKKEEIKKEVKLTENQKRDKESAIRRHKKRLDNLNEELLSLSNSLEMLESNYDMTKVEKEKESDNLIRRMSIIRYEIDIREGLVKWLS